MYPRSTYRVQLHAGFTLDHLTARVPYLHALGISDVYCPPVFQATAGSKHGYDVCDYSRVSTELGGEQALRRLSATLREHGMGLLLDFVPNHMGTDATLNGWWREVLEHGRQSRYADFFDISWEKTAAQKTEHVILPLLPSHYGCLLQDGKVRLRRDGGSLVLVCDALRFPVRAATYAEVLSSTAADGLENLGACFAWIEDSQNDFGADLRVREFDQLKHQLAEQLNANAAAADQLDAYLKNLNGCVGDPSSFDRLDTLIGAQHYRLARWQAGAHGVNYRRFFAINTLIGLRVEEAHVFAQVHAKLGKLIADGVVTGVRIDHIDGLRDPQNYLERLNALAEENRPPGAPPIYVVVEKILGREETLPSSWSTAGTTGYDFVPQLAGVFTAAKNEESFNRIYHDFTGMAHDFNAEVRVCKERVLAELFPSTVLRLAQSLRGLLQVDRRWRDLAVPELATAIGVLIGELAVYRTYRRSGESLSPEDHREVTRALVAALHNHPRLEAEVVIFVTTIWLGDYPEKGADEKLCDAFTQWVMNLQQYTGAVMAKSVEDTAYYTNNRLIALNEVGGFPEEFGRDLSAFHDACARREKQAAQSMLATSTHDTKASEDVRARLYALSEIPERWAAWLGDWRAFNARHKVEVGGKLAPDPQEEYRLYQTLLGAWPLDLGERGIDDEFRKRMGDYVEKSINEAKVHVSAANPSPDWIAGCRGFLDTVLSSKKNHAFLESFSLAAEQLARAGCVNSLAQTTLKLTVPGIPDVYQGNEAWDFSLVDPDNRRDVDFVGLEKLAGESARRSFRELLENWSDGGVKIALMRALLLLRRDFPKLFSDGAYTPLQVTGKLSGHVVAFARERTEDGQLVVVVPPLTAGLAWPPIGDVWRDNYLRIETTDRCWKNVLTGATVEPLNKAGISIADLFEELPVAVVFSKNTTA